MHQHSRPPPLTASPANSPRTNPTRTNNPRDYESTRPRPTTDRSTPNEQGIGMGEGSDTLMRGQEAMGQGRDPITKMSQIIQVRLKKLITKSSFILRTDERNFVELFHKSCPGNPSCKGLIASIIRQGPRVKKS